jgi:hypothetical protein
LEIPSKKPAIDENKTLIANPALVIALKSAYIDFTESVFEVLFKIWLISFLKTFAKVVYRKGFDKKQFIKNHNFVQVSIEKQV